MGPWCPIYGFGAVFISLLLSRHAEDPLAVFGLAILICGYIGIFSKLYVGKNISCTLVGLFNQEI